VNAHYKIPVRYRLWGAELPGQHNLNECSHTLLQGPEEASRTMDATEASKRCDGYLANAWAAMPNAHPQGPSEYQQVRLYALWLVVPVF
jgi:hypothetical protein